MKQRKFTEPETQPNSETFTGKAYLVEKETYLLSVAVELTIVDGLVVSKKKISTSDLPGTSVGVASSHLWSQLRGEK